MTPNINIINIAGTGRSAIKWSRSHLQWSTLKYVISVNSDHWSTLVVHWTMCLPDALLVLHIPHAECNGHYIGGVRMFCSSRCYIGAGCISSWHSVSVLQLADLAGCIQLTQLCLTGMEAPLERWPEKGLPSLMHLSLRDCSGVTDSTLDILPQVAPHLLKLTITGGEKRQQYRLFVYML